MLELLKHRRSIRTFTDEPVSQENIDSLLKAALLAPSSMGKKPVECIVVRNKETIARLKTYKKHGTTPLGTAPLAIVVIADGQKSDVWVEDASIVSILIQLEAEKLGLGSTWIQLRRREGDSGPSEEAFRQELGIPEHYGVLWKARPQRYRHRPQERAEETVYRCGSRFHQGPLRNVLRTLLVKNPCPAQRVAPLPERRGGPAVPQGS